MPSKPAGIQYAGDPRLTLSCQEAVLRLLQYGDRITHARILTCNGGHGLLLTTDRRETVGIKSGFASGYPGEGPRRFSYVLQVLWHHGVEISQAQVSQRILDRLDASALTEADMEAIRQAKRGEHWKHYMLPQHLGANPWSEFPPVIPFAIIDERLGDLALSFWDAPDDRLLTAWRRLEDAVRKRTGLKEHGAKLFSRAFVGEGALLQWSDKSAGEAEGAAQLFAAGFKAYRNRRAHREIHERPADQLTEFLMLNQLFRLEREAQPQGSAASFEDPLAAQQVRFDGRT